MCPKLGGFGEQFYSTWFKDEFANKIRLCLRAYCVTTNLENSVVATGLEKVSFHSNPKECDPLDCSLPGSTVHGIFLAKVLEWGAIVFSIKILYDEAILFL